MLKKGVRVFIILISYYSLHIMTPRQIRSIGLDTGFQVSYVDLIGTDLAYGFRSQGAEGSVYLQLGWNVLDWLQLSAGPSFGYQALFSRGTSSLGFLNPRLVKGYYIGGDIRGLFDFGSYFKPYIKGGAAYDNIENLPIISSISPGRQKLQGIRYNATLGFFLEAGPIWSIYLEAGLVAKTNLSGSAGRELAPGNADNTLLNIYNAINRNSNLQNALGYFASLGTSFRFHL